MLICKAARPCSTCHGNAAINWDFSSFTLVANRQSIYFNFHHESNLAANGALHLRLFNVLRQDCGLVQIILSS
jgi:hypothetical protein